MRNVWKGLMVGALTGAGIGLLLDIARAVGGGVKQAGTQTRDTLREHVPEFAAAVSAKATDVADRIKKADIPARATDMAKRVADSPQAHAVVESAHAASEAITEAAKEAAKKATRAVTENLPGGDSR